MPSTKQLVARLDMTGGLDSTTRPFMLPQEKWSVHHNMRTINSAVEAVAHKRVVGYVGLSEPITSLINVPVGRKNRVHFVGFTDSNVLQIHPDNVLASNVLQSGLATNSDYRRWATAFYNNQIWFTNELNTLRYTDGASVGQYTTHLPSAKYIAWFFDHCVVAYDTYLGDSSPTRVRWSHLYDPSLWTPGRGNEADFFDVVEWCRTDLGLMGVTGLAVMNNTLFVYLPSAIVQVQYVGLPTVMRFDPVVQDVGNSLQWGLATYERMHFFFDGNQQDFFMFDGQSAQSIGMPVIQYFADNLSTDYDLIQRTFAYVRPEKYEVVWRFVSRDSSSAHDRFVAYNWRNQRWHSGGSVAENEQCMGGMGRRVKTCDELTGTCNNLLNSCETLGDGTFAIQPRLWGSADSQVLREVVASDSTGLFLVQDRPTLETGDFFYGDLETVKEIDTIVIHASYVAATAGIEVSMSVRSLIDDAVVYTMLPQTWISTLPEGRLSFPRKAGRIFRFRFRPVDVNIRSFVWTVFNENVYLGKAEK